MAKSSQDFQVSELAQDMKLLDKHEQRSSFEREVHSLR